ncbi:MAG: RNA polymerase sigma factor [Bacteroidetes bacterium]|nr:RNA polymerase sigma factor [Bacteroidota bacterium]
MLNFDHDAAAFRAFIQLHQDRVFNTVLNRVQSVKDAEEITQDIFVDVFRRPEAFRGEAAVETWLYRIAINKSIDYLRKRRSRNRWHISSWLGSNEEQEEINAGADFFHPGVAAEDKEKAAILFKAMQQLPEKQHTAWVLHEMDNRSYKEIADIMQLSLSSVESLLVRARQNLKKILSRMYPERDR